MRKREGEILDPQLTRWTESLSRFKFIVKYINDNSNITADFLSRSIKTFLMASSTKTIPKQDIQFFDEFPIELQEKIEDLVINEGII